MHHAPWSENKQQRQRSYGGGAGTGAALGDRGPALQRRFAERLEMAVMELPARNAPRTPAPASPTNCSAIPA